MTKAGHVAVGLSLALLLKLEPVSTLIGAIFPDKDLIWGWGRKGKRTLWNAHRGFTHHAYLIPVLAVAGLSSPLYLDFPFSYLLLSFCMGYISHLVADALTPLGIPYTSSYYPRLSFPIFKTGSFLEGVVVALLFVFIALIGQGRLGEVMDRQSRVINSLLGRPSEATQLYAGGYVAVPDMTGYWEISSTKPFNFGCSVSGGRMYIYMSPKGEVYIYNIARKDYLKSNYVWKAEGEKLIIDNPRVNRTLFSSACRTVFRFTGYSEGCYQAVGKNNQKVAFCKED